MINNLYKSPPMNQLHMRWVLAALLSTSLLLLGYTLLLQEWGGSYARRWLLLSSAGIAYLLRLVWVNLEHNHRPGESQLLPGLGVANLTTILRGVLLALLTGFLFSPVPEGWLAWAPGLLYTTAALADALDGYLARRARQVTLMGSNLDIGLDGWGVLVASLLAVQYGQVPLWYLAVALARPLFLAGTWLRRRWGLPIHPLPPSVRRRTFAGLQMGFLFFILLPVFSPPGTHIAAAAFALPFLVGFLVDWLSVCGVLKNQSAGKSSSPGAARLLSAYLPLGLRLLAVLLLAVQLLSLPGSGVLTHLQVPVMLLLALGVSGRFTAIIGLSVLGLQHASAGLTLAGLTPAGLTPAAVALLLVYTAILYLGTGPFSLWKPEERLIFNRAGEQPS